MSLILLAVEYVVRYLSDQDILASDALASCAVRVFKHYRLRSCAHVLCAINAQAEARTILHQETGETTLGAIKHALEVMVYHIKKSFRLVVNDVSGG